MFRILLLNDLVNLESVLVNLESVCPDALLTCLNNVDHCIWKAAGGGVADLRGGGLHAGPSPQGGTPLPESRGATQALFFLGPSSSFFYKFRVPYSGPPLERGSWPYNIWKYLYTYFISTDNDINDVLLMPMINSVIKFL